MCALPRHQLQPGKVGTTLKSGELALQRVEMHYFGHKIYLPQALQTPSHEVKGAADSGISLEKIFVFLSEFSLVTAN